MQRKTLFAVSGCLFCSIGLVLVLYLLSDRNTHRKNGFIRLFPPHIITTSKTLDTKHKSYYIAGATSQSIYLNSYVSPTHLLVSDYALRDTQMVQLGISDKIEIFAQGLNVEIDSPYIYMIEGMRSVILRSKLPELHLTPYIDSPHFSSTLAVTISPSSFALRTYDRSLSQNILTKLSLDSPHIKNAPRILEKQIDGVFCTDGMLHYNPDLGCLVYVYFYRNQFVCLDTSLNLLYKENTIDTISRAKIKVTEIKSEKKSTLSAPPLVVNKTSCVAGNWLFINSASLANNEDDKSFNDNSVIDIYSIKDGRYHYSFYLPDIHGKKISSFRVFDKTLVAIYDHYLTVYGLNL